MDIEGIKSLIRVAPGVKNIEVKGSLLKFTLLSDVEAQLEIVKGVGSLFLYAILSEIPKYTQYRLPLLEDVLMGNYFSQLTGKFQIALSPDKELLLLFIEIKGRQIKELTSYIEKFNYYYSFWFKRIKSKFDPEAYEDMRTLKKKGYRLNDPKLGLVDTKMQIFMP